MKQKRSEALEEQMLSAWINLNGILKDSLMTQGLTYNEAIVMNLVYRDFQKGQIRTSMQQLITMTGFLKSLMNRTISSLCQQGYLQKIKEGRNLYVSLIENKLSGFLEIHDHSLSLAREIVKVIGVDDAERFIKMSTKLNESPIRDLLKG